MTRDDKGMTKDGSGCLRMMKNERDDWGRVGMYGITRDD